MHYRRWKDHGDPLIVWPNKAKRCSVEGCNEKSDAKGFCPVHYMRFKRHGDPLATSNTPYGLPLAFLEEAITRETDDCIEWPFSRNGLGYGTVIIDGKTMTAPRAVLERAKGPPPHPKSQAAHLPEVCHNPACINLRHLRWASPQENAADRNLDGTANTGERAGPSRLTTEQVLRIRADPRRQALIAKDYDVSQGTVSGIKSRRTWRHLP